MGEKWYKAMIISTMYPNVNIICTWTSWSKKYSLYIWYSNASQIPRTHHNQKCCVKYKTTYYSQIIWHGSKNIFVYNLHELWNHIYCRLQSKDLCQALRTEHECNVPKVQKFKIYKGAQSKNWSHTTYKTNST